MNLSPVTLSLKTARLEPLKLEHAAALSQMGSDASIWTYMRYGVVDNEEKMRAFIQDLLDHQTRGTDLAFTVFHIPTGQAVGMTRYLNIEAQNRAVEIGGTWYAPAFQRTGMNTECKYLLLQYAFETLDCLRVQIKTDLRNERSQRAIERLGAVKEGVLRDHMILPDGTVRSSVFYSILAREWPDVKQHLLTLMDR